MSGPAREARLPWHDTTFGRPPSQVSVQRWRPCPAGKLPVRTCFVCGECAPEHGPVGWEWDAHHVAGLDALELADAGKQRTCDALVMTCSAQCRAARGLLERKVG